MTERLVIEPSRGANYWQPEEVSVYRYTPTSHPRGLMRRTFVEAYPTWQEALAAHPTATVLPTAYPAGNFDPSGARQPEKA